MKSFDISHKKQWKYTLDRVHLDIVHLDTKTSSSSLYTYQFPQIYEALCEAKNQIQLYPRIWDKRKRLVNNLERIYRFPNCRENLIRFNPISRAFFKMWEMLHVIRLPNSPITIVCLAEAPGGFVESLFRKRRTIRDIIHGISLGPTSYVDDVPNWMLSNSIDFTIHSGDLTNVSDIERFVPAVIVPASVKKVQLITADGGFDVSDAYNDQEVRFHTLFAGEVLSAFLLQAVGGTFIIKVFDLLSVFSMQLLFILTIYYEKVIIYKPDFSRAGNSERYLICTGFKGDVLNAIIDTLKDVLENKDIITSFQFRGMYMSREFILAMFNYNYNFSLEQISSINEIIELSKCIYIERSQLQIIQQRQYKSSLLWCEKYNLL
jgi:23S rRNA U2552 (ribose-2'-O)-methylase RlmE/FtsJ